MGNESAVNYRSFSLIVWNTVCPYQDKTTVESEVGGMSLSPRCPSFRGRLVEVNLSEPHTNGTEFEPTLFQMNGVKKTFYERLFHACFNPVRIVCIMTAKHWYQVRPYVILIPKLPARLPRARIWG